MLDGRSGCAGRVLVIGAPPNDACGRAPLVARHRSRQHVHPHGGVCPAGGLPDWECIYITLDRPGARLRLALFGVRGRGPDGAVFDDYGVASDAVLVLELAIVRCPCGLSQVALPLCAVFLFWGGVPSARGAVGTRGSRGEAGRCMFV